MQKQLKDWLPKIEKGHTRMDIPSPCFLIS